MWFNRCRGGAAPFLMIEFTAKAARTGSGEWSDGTGAAGKLVPACFKKAAVQKKRPQLGG
jgi:hypothetical protein